MVSDPVPLMLSVRGGFVVVGVGAGLEVVGAALEVVGAALDVVGAALVVEGAAVEESVTFGRTPAG